MKYFEIRNELSKTERHYGILLCDEEREEFLAELSDDLSFEEAPLLLDSVIQKGKRTVLPYVTGLWIRERIVPQDRQNIGAILKNHHLEFYNAYQLLALSDGRCAQDDFYLREISGKEAQPFLKKRSEKRIVDFVMIPPTYARLFFQNGQTKYCDLTEVAAQTDWFRYVTRNENYFRSARRLIAGCGIGWEGEREIAAEDLYRLGRVEA